MADTTFTEAEFDTFRLYRLVGEKRSAEALPLTVGDVFEFPSSDLMGPIVFERWGEGDYRAKLFIAGAGLTARGQSFNCHVDKNGIVTRCGDLKTTSKGIIEAKIARAREGVTTSKPITPATEGEAPIVPPVVVHTPAQLANDAVRRATLRAMNGEEAIELLTWCEDRVLQRQAQHEHLRLTKTVEALTEAGKFERRVLEHAMTSSRELDERKLKLEMQNVKERIELNAQRRELDAEIEGDAEVDGMNEQIDDLKTKLARVSAATTHAEAVAAAGSLIPLLVNAAPILIQLPMIQKLLTTVAGPTAVETVKALIPMAPALLGTPPTPAAT